MGLGIEPITPTMSLQIHSQSSNSFKWSVNSAWQTKLHQWIRRDAWRRHFKAKVESKSNKFAIGQDTLWNKLSPAHGDVLHSLGREQRCGLEGTRQENQNRAERLQQWKKSVNFCCPGFRSLNKDSNCQPCAANPPSNMPILSMI